MSIRKILASIRRADETYNLFENDDYIAVGVSGGKDSMALIKALKNYVYFPKKNFKFIAVYLNLGFPCSDIQKLEEYCKNENIPLHIEDRSDVYKILIQHKNNKGLLPCSICSRMKKAAINKVAHELGCNKVAFAHHADDAIETLLLNTIYGGRVATFAPKMYLSNTKLTFIRPLILTRESEISSFCKKENIPIIKNKCGNDKNTQREEVKKLLNNLYKKYPESKDNYLTMLVDPSHFDLWYSDIQNQIGDDFTINEALSKEDIISCLNFKKEYFKISEKDIFSKHFILKNKENIIGTIRCYEFNSLFYLDHLVIKDDYRNKLLGQRLIKFVENYYVSKVVPFTFKVKIKKDDNYSIFLKLNYTIEDEDNNYIILTKTMDRRHPKI